MAPHAITPRRTARRTPRRTALTALCLLTLAGCTGDPVDDPSADDPSEDAPTSPDGDAAAQLPAVGPAGGPPTTAAAETPAVSDAPPDATPDAPSAPSTPSAAGTVDCASALPCTLRSPDGAFEIVLSAADGEAADGSGAPRTDFAVEALTRDVALGIDLASSLTADGEVAAGTIARFGAGSARRADATTDTELVARHFLIPGLPINGHVAFADTRATEPATIDRLELVVHEAGVRTGLAFANVPWGPAASAAVDCALALPCTWSAPGGDATLVVDAVGLERWHNATRTIVDWRAGAARGLTLQLADAASATTDEGDPLEYYGIELGGATSRGEGPLDDVAGPDAPAAGRTVFRRAPPEGVTALGTLELHLVERRAPRVPRWRVVLTNLPLTR